MNLDGLATLRAEFTARGWHRRATGAVVGELLFHITLAVAGYVTFLLADDFVVRWLGMLVSTYGTLGVATNTHTSTHNGTSDKRWVNDLLSYIGYPLFVSLSVTYWRHSHISIHHTSPNVMGVDCDADFTPYFVTTDRELAESTGWRRRFFERYQAWVFPVLMWLHPWLRQRASWAHIFSRLGDPEQRRPAHWIDLGFMLLYWVVWFGIPCLFLSPWEAFLASQIRIGMISYPLFAILAPAHYPHEAGCVRVGDWPKDFLALQTSTTINFRTGPIGGFICSGLQYQIEHHLFPGYSHVHYKKMSPFVREFCEKNGYPYRTMGWGEALYKTFLIFVRPKHEEPDLATLRERHAKPTAQPSSSSP